MYCHDKNEACICQAQVKLGNLASHGIGQHGWEAAQRQLDDFIFSSEYKKEVSQSVLLLTQIRHKYVSIKSPGSIAMHNL